MSEQQQGDQNEAKASAKEAKKKRKQVLVTLSDSPLLQEHKVKWTPLNQRRSTFQQ